MSIVQAIILGIVEGVTEFLPISSTGHLILAADLMKIKDSDFLTTFEIVIQLGAILSVVVLYWRRIVLNKSLMKKIVVAFIPTAIVGLVFYPYIKNYLLGSTQVVLWSLFLGGVVIYALEKWFMPNHKGVDLEQMTYKQAASIGLVQSIAIVPGVSRAAATILGGMFAGLDRKSIVEFSFMLAIPTMAAASGWDLFQTAGDFSGMEFGVLAVGFIVSFITAFFAVRWLLKYIQGHDFSSFGVYRIALAILFWLTLF